MPILGEDFRFIPCNNISILIYNIFFRKYKTFFWISKIHRLLNDGCIMCYHTIEISSNSVNVNPSQNLAFLQRKISSPALVYPSSFFIFSKDKKQETHPFKKLFFIYPDYICVCVGKVCKKWSYKSTVLFHMFSLYPTLSYTHTQTHTILTLPWRSPPLVNEKVCVCVCVWGCRDVYVCIYNCMCNKPEAFFITGSNFRI